MNRRAAARYRPRGFTLIELLITLAIVAILGMLAAPSFQHAFARSQLSSTTNSFASAVMQARSEAIRGNRRTYLVPGTPGSGSDWAQGWTVYQDMNGNGSYDSGTDTLVVSAAPVDPRLASSAVTGSLSSLSFDGTGYPNPLASGCVEFHLSTNPWGENARQVVMAASGRVRVLQAAAGTACPANP